MSSFWSWWVIIITVGNIVACYWLVRWATKPHVGEVATGDVTGHKWDDNLEEYNNPLPRWWLWLFYITIVFGFIYLALYPGLGTIAGTIGLTSSNPEMAFLVGFLASVMVSPTLTSLASLIPVMTYPTSPALIS